jgi:hypothetical protein
MLAKALDCVASVASGQINVTVWARKNGSREKLLRIFAATFKQMPVLGLTIETMRLVAALSRNEWTIPKISQMEICSSFGL